MLKFIKNLFSFPSEQERMYRYLAQAVDVVHLEALQREWDSKSYQSKKWC